MKTKILLNKIGRYGLEDIEAFVRRSIDLFDPSRSLFRPGQRVLFKPNFLRAFGPERCVTTHPKVIEAVCRVLKDLSVGKIDISDSSALGSLKAAAKKGGYNYLVPKYGLNFVPLKNPVTLFGSFCTGPGINLKPTWKRSGSVRTKISNTFIFNNMDKTLKFFKMPVGTHPRLFWR